MHSRTVDTSKNEFRKNLADLAKFPLDMMDDVIVSVKDFINMSAHLLEALIGGAFGVLTLWYAIQAAKELYDDLCWLSKFENTLKNDQNLKEYNECIERIKKNSAILFFSLGATSLALSMVIGGTTGLTILGMTFFPLAIMASLTVISLTNLCKTLREYHDTDPNDTKKRAELSTKIKYQVADFVATAIITAAIGFAAFSLFASINVLGLGIPLLIIVTVASVAIGLKFHENRHLFGTFCKKGVADDAGTMASKTPSITDAPTLSFFEPYPGDVEEADQTTTPTNTSNLPSTLNTPLKGHS